MALANVELANTFNQQRIRINEIIAEIESGTILRVDVPATGNLSLTGSGSFSGNVAAARFLAANGTVADPGLSFSAFANTGLALNATGLLICTNGQAQWIVDQTGHWLAGTDNVKDIGASGASRPRTMYVGTSAAIGASPAAGATVSIAGGTITTDAGANGVVRATQTWSNATVEFTAVGVDLTDTNSHANSNLIDTRVGGASRFRVIKDGTVEVAAAGGLQWVGRSRVTSSGDGVVSLLNAAGTGFTRLTLGVSNTTAGVALVRSGTTLRGMLGDASAYAPFEALTVAANAVTANTVASLSTGVASLKISGGMQAGTSNVQILGADGRIPAISSTQFANLSGANLTGIPETAIADGAIFPRLAASEIITGVWDFDAPQIFSASSDRNIIIATNTGNKIAIRIRGNTSDNLAFIDFTDSTETVGYGSIGVTPGGGLSYNAAFTGHTFIGRVNSGTTQPGFEVVHSADQSTGAFIINLAWDTEIQDQAGNFATNTFTAPATGTYLFVATVTVHNTSGTTSTYTVRFTVAGSVYQVGSHMIPSNITEPVNGTLMIPMAAGTSVTCSVSSLVASYTVKAGVLLTRFSGRLLL